MPGTILNATLIIFLVSTSFSAAIADESPQPQEAVSAIVAAFEQVPLVAIGEKHDIRQMSDFYTALIRDERFRAQADAIVLEIANAFHQPILDAYTSGENVPMERLRSVWQDATNCFLQDGEMPHYKQLLQTVREANASSPSEKQLRVLAGDPPIDWNAPDAKKQYYAAHAQRDRHYAAVVGKEILSKGKKALLIMGRSHLTRITSSAEHENVATILQREAPGSLYIIHLLTHSHERIKHLESWPVPSVAELQGSWLAAISSEAVMIKISGKRPSLGETIDAVLWLGPGKSLESFKTVPFSDENFLRERERREKLLEK